MMSRKKSRIVQDHILSFIPDNPGTTREETFVRTVLMTYYRGEGNGIIERMLEYIGFDTHTIADAILEWINEGGVLAPGDAEVVTFLETIGKKSSDEYDAWLTYCKVLTKEGEKMFLNIRRNMEASQSNAEPISVTYNYATPTSSIRANRSKSRSASRRRRYR